MKGISGATALSTSHAKAQRWRWLALSVFILSSALNFLDRQLLAALAPTLQQAFRLTDVQYGYVISAFSLPYALSAPLMGMLIDRVGLRRGPSIAVSIWSFAGMATGLVSGLPGLLVTRALLGVGEGGGIPGSGKAAASYLLPRERALGSAFSQFGLTVGGVCAPLLAAWISPRYGWQTTFLVTGSLGFLWIPLWLAVSRAIPPTAESPMGASLPLRAIVRDARLWALVIANLFAMPAYSLWGNWTTKFLVKQFALPEALVNQQYAWWPPVFATLGGLTGGWLSLQVARRGADIQQARFRVAAGAAILLLLTAVVPAMPTAPLATAGICFSLFCTLCVSVNLYAIPLDLFGTDRAAFATAVLTAAYGLLQTVLSPLIGHLVMSSGYGLVCALAGALPLVSLVLLRWVVRQPSIAR